MAGAIIAGLASDVLSSGLGSLINAGAGVINQKVDFENNKQLQQNSFQFSSNLQQASFQHDKEMLQAQIEATKKLQQEMMGIKQAVLLKGGFSETDAARGAVNAPMTKVLDWSGTRYWAPNASTTTYNAGRFSTPQPSGALPGRTNLRTAAPARGSPSISSNASTATSVYSNQTVSTRLGTSAGSGTSVSSLPSTARTRSWVEDQNRNLSPFMRGAHNISFVTPPSSRSSSQGTVSTVPKEVLDSWTGAFNTRRQPLFAHIRKRGESRV
ncbi:capsid protein VP2 [Norovirus Hu/GII.4/NIHIC28.5/2012/USA]|uniref:Capsid protein VP2 n=3 Tax=Norovirus GII.4 TaxID=489821 RepID=S5Y3Y6_NORV|nr:capsid protein VP2 [Norovirus Hu/GII.4/NIHIC28.4/2012/USA]AGT17831.1 capsid protein VP2 [Norovirus Hu/GII.4/NIHIC28.5/2012/USA]AGX85923.1 capsid protein VP2 [Norovirus Hu/GII.4/NIHIC28.3/2012/USA]